MAPKAKSFRRSGRAWSRAASPRSHGLAIAAVLAATIGCSTGDAGTGGTGPVLADSASVIFLHHSTGANIWAGGVPQAIADYNSAHGTSYGIVELAYPSSGGYGWANYPFDYWNIWVDHASDDPYLTEPNLASLAAEHDVIVWKHCFPVSQVVAPDGNPDVTSSVQTDANYRLQYEALKAKMHAYPDNRFIVWTGAALVQGATNPEYAARARDFFHWVVTSWDEPGDNIYVWDFRRLETNGGLYMLDANAASATDSHPNSTFSATVAPYLAQRIIDVIEGRGDTGSLTGT
jgi:hypothetical protein